MKKIVLLLCSFIFWGFLNAQKLSGIILNENNEPVSGATITLNDARDYKISNQQGIFEFDKLKPGKIKLIIKFLGYETYADTIEINDKDISLEITLKISENLTDEVVVKALRTNNQTPVPTTEIDKKDLYKNNLGKDVPYLLNLSPSVTISSDGGTGIGYSKLSIRGTDLTRINVTVNGIPLNDAESHGVYWVDLPDLSSSVENIQVQRGVGSSTNGAGAFGANINFMTNELQKEAYGQLSSSYGSFNSSKITLKAGTGLLNKHFAFDIRLSGIHSDGYIDRARTDMESFYGSGSYTNSKTLVKMNIITGKEETYQAWNGVPKDTLEAGNRTYNAYTYKNEIDHYLQNHYQAFISHKINTNLLINFAFNYTKGKGYYEQYKSDENLADYQIDSIIIGNEVIKSTDLVRRKWLDNDFYVANLSLTYQKKGIKAVLGGSYQDYFGRHYGTVIWARFAGNSEIDHQWYYSTGDKIEYNIYGKFEYPILNRFNFYVDFQFRQINYRITGIDDNLKDLSQHHIFSFFNPKLGLSFMMSNFQKIYFAYGRANREPSRTDFKDAQENKVPTPETLDDYECGYNMARQRFSFNLNLYYMTYNNQLVKTGKINDVGDAILTNIPKSYRTGIEVSGILKIFSFMNWNFNFTLSRNKIKDFTEYVDNWDIGSQNAIFIGETNLSFSPEIIAGSELEFNLFKGFNITLISKFVGQQYIDNTSSADRKLEPYFVNDIRLLYNFKTKFIKSIDLQLTINNVFNCEYETDAWVYRYYYDNAYYLMDGYFPQAGTHMMAGVVLNF